MKGAISLGRLFGINILLHWSFILILLYIGYRSFAIGMSPTGITKEILFVFAVFSCVVLHELGHALAARGYGIQTKRILILPIGGVAQLERMPEKPSQELWVALAGPLVNVGIALVLAPLAYFFAPEGWMNDPEVLVENFLLRMILINILLVVFNLIPAFPMDGGRILRALLAFKFDYTKSTVIAGRIGQIVALAFIITGFLNLSLWMLILIGAFVIMGAEAEIRMVRFKNARKEMKIREVMIEDAPTLLPGQTVGDAIKMVINGAGSNFLVVDGSNHVQGILTKNILMQAYTQSGNDSLIAEIMLTDFPDLSPDEPVDTALKAMEQYKLPLIPVIENNNLAGAVDVDKLILILSGMEKG